MLELECQRMSVPNNMPEQPVTTTRTLDIDDCIAHKIFANCTTVKSMAKACSPPKCTVWRETPNTDDGTIMGPRVCCLSHWTFHRHVIKKIINKFAVHFINWGQMAAGQNSTLRFCLRAAPARIQLMETLFVRECPNLGGQMWYQWHTHIYLYIILKKNIYIYIYI